MTAVAYKNLGKDKFQILFLTDDREDYLPDGILHGLKHIPGIQVTDYPKKNCLYQTCLEEMDKAIAIMSSKTSPNILKKAKALNNLLSISKLPILKQLAGKRAIEKMLSKTIGKRLFKETGYNLISWNIEQSDWVESYLPFR